MTGKKWNIHKYVEIKQHSLKNLGVEIEIKRNKTLFEMNEKEIQYTKTEGM